MKSLKRCFWFIVGFSVVMALYWFGGGEFERGRALVNALLGSLTFGVLLIVFVKLFDESRLSLKSRSDPAISQPSLAL